MVEILAGLTLGIEVETRRLKADNTALTRDVAWLTSTLTAGSGASGAYFSGVTKTENTLYGAAAKTTRVENTFDKLRQRHAPNLARRHQHGRR